MKSQLIYNGAYFFGVLTVCFEDKAVLKYYNARTTEEMTDSNDFKLVKDLDNCVHWAALHCAENDWKLWGY